MSNKLLLAVSVAALLNVSPALAQNNDTELQALKAQLQQLQNKVEAMEAQKTAPKSQNSVTKKSASSSPNTPATAQRSVKNNSFNPEIGMVLNGKFNSFSSDEGEIAGFTTGEEGERGEEGLSIDETELNFSANVDDKFRGAATVALHEHDGEVEVELEEAYVATTALPAGLEVKAGRFFSEVGYLNSHHAHADDFADRPLPNRVFLDSNYGDDGVQVSAVLPTPIYSEVGLGAFRGADFPAGGAEGSDIGAYTAYGRVGGDVGDNTSWRLGLSTLQSDGGISREVHEGEIVFEGDSDLYVADARLTYAPTGNSQQQELILQGEYFYRDEDGTYEDVDAATGAVAYDDSQSGWYAQSVYKFHPQWRAGARYSQLYAGDVPVGLVGSELDGEGHDPWSATAMVDWTNSEFSRVRAQYSHEEGAEGEGDNQITLQYIMSLGAHGAHPF